MEKSNSKLLLLSILFFGSLFQLLTNWKASLILRAPDECIANTIHQQKASEEINDGEDICQGYEGVLRIRSGDEGEIILH